MIIPRTVRLNGERFRVFGDSEDPYFKAIRFHARDQANFYAIASKLDRDSIALDVGSNIGLTALPLSRIVRRVHCFEPCTKAFETLCKTIKENGIENCVVHNIALSDNPGEVDFHTSRNSSGSHVVTNEHASRPDTVRVPCESLDSLMSNKEIASASFVKIDAEGSELRILKGGRQFLNSPRTLYMEFNAWCLLSHERLNPLDVMYKLVADFDVSAIEKRRFSWRKTKPIFKEDVFTFVHDHIMRGCVDDLLLRPLHPVLGEPPSIA